MTHDPQKALKNVRAAILEASVHVITDTLWMPERISQNETVVEYIDAALRRLADAETGAKPSIPTCCVTGAIPGDGGACGDCDPCLMGEARPVCNHCYILMPVGQDGRPVHGVTAARQLSYPVAMFCQYCLQPAGVAQALSAGGDEAKKSEGSPVQPDQGVASQHEYPDESRSGRNSSRNQSATSDPTAERREIVARVQAAVTEHCHINMKWPAKAQLDEMHFDDFVKDILAALDAGSDA